MTSGSTRRSPERASETSAVRSIEGFPNLETKLDTDGLHEAMENGANIGFPEDLRKFIYQGRIKDGLILQNSMTDLNISFKGLNEILDELEGEENCYDVIFENMDKSSRIPLRGVLPIYLYHENIDDYQIITNAVKQATDKGLSDDASIEDLMGSADHIGKETLGEYKAELTRLENEYLNEVKFSELVTTLDTIKTNNTNQENTAIATQGLAYLQQIGGSMDNFIDYLKQFAGKDEEELEENGLVFEHPQIIHPDYIDSIKITAPTKLQEEPFMKTIDNGLSKLEFTALFMDSCSMFGFNYEDFLELKDGDYILNLDNKDNKFFGYRFITYLNTLTNKYSKYRNKTIPYDNLTEAIHYIRQKPDSYNGLNLSDERIKAFQEQSLANLEMEYNNLKSYTGEDEVSIEISNILKDDRREMTLEIKAEKLEDSARISLLPGSATEPKRKQRLRDAARLVRTLIEAKKSQTDETKIQSFTSLLFTDVQNTVMFETNDNWGPLSFITNDQEMSLSALDSTQSQRSKVEQHNLFKQGQIEANFHMQLLDASRDASGKLQMELFKKELISYTDYIDAGLFRIPTPADSESTNQEKINAIKQIIDRGNFEELNAEQLRLLKRGAFNKHQGSSVESRILEQIRLKEQSSQISELEGALAKRLQEVAGGQQIAKTPEETQRILGQAANFTITVGALSQPSITKRSLQAIKENGAELLKAYQAGSEIKFIVYQNEDGWVFEAGLTANIPEGVVVGLTFGMSKSEQDDSMITTTGFGLKAGTAVFGTDALQEALGELSARRQWTWLTDSFLGLNSIGGSIGANPYGAFISGNIGREGFTLALYEQFSTHIEETNLEVNKERTEEDKKKTYEALYQITEAQATTTKQLNFLLDNSKSYINFKAIIEKHLEQIKARFTTKAFDDNQDLIKKAIMTELASSILGQLAQKTSALDFNIRARATITWTGSGMLTVGGRFGVNKGQTMIGTRYLDTAKAHETLLAQTKGDRLQARASAVSAGTLKESRGYVSTNGDSAIEKESGYMKRITENGLKYHFVAKTGEEPARHYLQLDPNSATLRGANAQLYVDSGNTDNPDFIFKEIEIDGNKQLMIEFDPEKPLYIKRENTFNPYGDRSKTQIISLSRNPNKTASRIKTERPRPFFAKTRSIGTKGRMENQVTSYTPAEFTASTEGLQKSGYQLSGLEGRRIAIEPAKTIEKETIELISAIGDNPKLAASVFKAARITATNQQVDPAKLIKALITFATKLTAIRKRIGNRKHEFNISKLQEILKIGNPNFEAVAAQLNPTGIERISTRLKSQADLQAQAVKVGAAADKILEKSTGVQNVEIMYGHNPRVLPENAEGSNRVPATELKDFTLMSPRLPLGSPDDVRGFQPADILNPEQTQILKLNSSEGNYEHIALDNTIVAAHKLWDKSTTVAGATEGYARTEASVLMLTRGADQHQQNILTDLYGAEGANGVPGKYKDHWENILQEIQKTYNGNVEIKNPYGVVVGEIRVTKEVRRVFLANCVNPAMAFKLDLKYTPVSSVVSASTNLNRSISGAISKQQTFAIGADLLVGSHNFSDRDNTPPTASDKQQSISPKRAAATKPRTQAQPIDRGDGRTRI